MDPESIFLSVYKRQRSIDFSRDDFAKITSSIKSSFNGILNSPWQEFVCVHPCAPITSVRDVTVGGVEDESLILTGNLDQTVQVLMDPFITPTASRLTQERTGTRFMLGMHATIMRTVRDRAAVRRQETARAGIAGRMKTNAFAGRRRRGGSANTLKSSRL